MYSIIAQLLLTTKTARYRWLSRQAVATRTYEDHSNRWEVDYVLRGTSFGAAIDAALSRSDKS